MNTSFSDLLLKTLFLSIAMLIGLSISMWLLAQYSPETWRHKEGLINTVQAKADLPTPQKAPVITAQQSLSALKQAPLSTSPAPSNPNFIRAIKADETRQSHRMVLHFDQSFAQLNNEQASSLKAALQQLSIGRNDRVKITAGAVSQDPRINDEHHLKLRTQAIARVVFAYTQEVEIVLGETLSEAGTVVLQINTLKK